MHNIRYVKARACMFCQCNVILSLLVLLSCTVAAADEESIVSTGISAKEETESQKYDLIQPNLHLLEYDEKENLQIMRLLASSTSEKELDTRDLQNLIPAPASGSTKAISAQPDIEQKWQTLFPFFGDGAEKRGYKLPYAIGVTPGFYYGRRHIKVSNAKVVVGDFTIPADRFTKIKVKSREKNWSVRLDAWIFPFLSVYALGGYTRQYTDAAISLNLPDRMRSRRGADSRDFRVSVDLTGITYGGGITLVGGYKNYFAAFDSNFTISALRGDLVFGNRLSPDVRARLCSIRLGWRKQFGDARLNLWVGETNWDTTNTIRGNPDIPVLGKVGFSLKEGTIKPWSTHMGTHIEITKTFQFMVDVGTNFAGLFCITPAFMFRF